MPRDDKSQLTKKQKRQAEQMKERYEARGHSEAEAERRARVMVDKVYGSDEQSLSYNAWQDEGHEPMQRATKKGNLTSRLKDEQVHH